nr:immunoglobulin heavy chain junction region [Macaca mulatta]MOX60233.1 immunoglobulin heavy chain junction region [Macaca mulatta]MOX60585.1 immunoglobulin heavy chain junction region [Macaca mulatta]MOX60657.1 immunoglobulin heavy chain junction region [Macaca mulatta]MOX62890.1 immunoglobulin heavy chain junction region [Macaca mulatta]
CGRDDNGVIIDFW